jgi:membrane protein required for colicin V production
MPNIRVLPEILGFIGIFLIVFFLIKLVENILKDIINRINLTGLDHFFGIILGIAEGGLVACVILFILTIQPLFDAAPLLKGSIFASYLMPLIEWGYYYLLGAGAA